MSFHVQPSTPEAAFMSLPVTMLLAVQDKNPAAQAAEEFNKLATAYAVRDVASGYHRICMLSLPVITDELQQLCCGVSSNPFELHLMVQVLGNNESRGSYDYALAHPREHMIAYYARYGSRAYAQMKIPAHYSITGLILTISFIQYLSRKMSHEKVCTAPAPVWLWSARFTLKDKASRWICIAYTDRARPRNASV